ncbi:MAG TPA: TPM domain-containing protein [Longimicrobium sp.]|jgi:uncharacterized protein
MKPTPLALAAAGLLLAAPARAQGAYPENTGAAVTDLAEVLTRAQEDSVRALLAGVRNSGADVRVVTIGSVHDYSSGAASIEAFATGLFNAWRVGDRAENDGALLLVAVRDRRVRIELGDGAPPSFDARAKQAIDERIVPEFRAGHFAAGILAGAGEIARWYREEPASSPAAPPAGGGYAPAREPFAGQPAAPQPYYVPPPRDSRSPDGAGGGIGLLLGLGGLGAAAVGAAAYARNRKRKCPGCGTEMERLDEVSDDVYLDSGQKMEEWLKSVDYDVWKCGSCGNHLLLPYNAWFTSAKPCPGCRYRTCQVSRRTLERPTYHSTGTDQVTQHCRHCGYHHEHLVTLPRLTPPPEREESSSSWSSGSSSGRGASGGWSSSGSSGGSHSSGRGASGSW